MPRTESQYEIPFFMQPATRQYIIENYGKSRNQIALEIATGLYINQHYSAKQAWDATEAFLEEMAKRITEKQSTPAA